MSMKDLSEEAPIYLPIQEIEARKRAQWKRNPPKNIVIRPGPNPEEKEWERLELEAAQAEANNVSVAEDVSEVPGVTMEGNVEYENALRRARGKPEIQQKVKPDAVHDNKVKPPKRNKRASRRAARR